MSQSNLNLNALQLQKEAIEMIAKALVSNHSEVAILTLAPEPRIKQNLTNNWNNVSQNLKNIEIKGKINFISGIRTAFSALKNKAKDNMKLRIILFVGSNVESDIQEFIDLAKHLREEKLKPVIQIVGFGINNEANNSQLSTFILLLRNKDSCLWTIAETQFLKILLIGSPILERLSVYQFKDYRTTGVFEEESDLEKAINLSIEQQKQDEEMGFGLQFKALELNYSKTNNNKFSEDMLLQKAIAESLKDIESNNQIEEIGFPSDPQNIIISDMTEEEQIAYALKISLSQMNNELEQKEKSSDNSRVNKTIEKTNEE
jgi:hypothetical protein